MSNLVIQVCCPEAYLLVESGIVFTYNFCPYCGALIEIIKTYKEDKK